VVIGLVMSRCWELGLGRGADFGGYAGAGGLWLKDGSWPSISNAWPITVRPGDRGGPGRRRHLPAHPGCVEQAAGAGVALKSFPIIGSPLRKVSPADNLPVIIRPAWAAAGQGRF